MGTAHRASLSQFLERGSSPRSDAAEELLNDCSVSKISHSLEAIRSFHFGNALLQTMIEYVFHSKG